MVKMKRCFFIGLKEIYDSKLTKRIYDELEKMIETNETVEFWFFRFNNSFIRNCLHIALLFKYKYPQKDIKIIRIVDPVINTVNSKSQKNNVVYDITLPGFVIDRFVYAKHFRTDLIKAVTDPIRRINQIETWAIKQCNYVIAYCYPFIDYHLGKIIRSISKRPDVIVNHICFDETERYIREKVESLDQRTKDIFNMFNAGETIVSVAKKIGISDSRVSKITENARQIIYQSAKQINLHRITKRDRRCVFAFLSKCPSSTQLKLFECFLNYLVHDCGIKEFWIDEKTCNSMYLNVLGSVKFHYWGKPLIKIFLPVGEGKEDEWETFVDKYKSLVSNIVGICASDDNIFSEIVRKAKYMVTDFTFPESSLIREQCLPDNDIFVFDTSPKEISIDDQYIEV